MLRHDNQAGFHVCTTHQVIDASGQPVHWDEASVNFTIVTVAKRSLQKKAADARKK
jgi:hypothetical protein